MPNLTCLGGTVGDSYAYDFRCACSVEFTADLDVSLADALDGRVRPTSTHELCRYLEIDAVVPCDCGVTYSAEDLTTALHGYIGDAMEDV